MWHSVTDAVGVADSDGEAAHVADMTAGISGVPETEIENVLLFRARELNFIEKFSVSHTMKDDGISISTGISAGIMRVHLMRDSQITY